MVIKSIKSKLNKSKVSEKEAGNKASEEKAIITPSAKAVISTKKRFKTAHKLLKERKEAFEQALKKEKEKGRGRK